MFNKAKFQIIGRIGSINNLEKVTHLSIASDRRTRNEDGEWTTQSEWNSVTIFSEALRKRLSNPATARHGNLIIAEGTIQSSAYDRDGEKQYRTALVAEEFEVLSFTKEK